MDIQRLYSLVRKGIDRYSLINEGDKIAIGISGGKDSLALLYALAGLRQFYSKKFDIVAITVKTGAGGMDFQKVAELCQKLEVEYHIVETKIYDIVFNERKEHNPCSLCAKLRKGAFNEEALKYGCNKIAYAHHMDDFIETLYMSMMYEGSLHTFSPVTYLEKTGLTLIRPMIFVEEKDIIGFKNKYELPVVKNMCPADGYTKREYVKNLLKQIYYENKGAKSRIFNAIVTGNFDDWPKL